jgi:hypothetical protein
MEEQTEPHGQENEFANNPIKRGGCLAVFLIVMMVLNTLTTLYYLLAIDTVERLMPNMPAGGVYILAVFGILNALFAFAVWNWKKIGIYGFMGSAILIFLFNMYIGVGFTAIFGLLGPIILFFLIKPVWRYMK